MKPGYMVIRVELRTTLGSDQPVRRKEAVLDLARLKQSPLTAAEVVSMTANMVARTMWDEAVLMGLGDD